MTPARDLAFRFGPEFVWRASVDDAVYISRTSPLPATMAARDRASLIGTNLIGAAQWNLDDVHPHRRRWMIEPV